MCFHYTTKNHPSTERFLEANRVNSSHLTRLGFSGFDGLVDDEDEGDEEKEEGENWGKNGFEAQRGEQSGVTIVRNNDIDKN